MEPKSIQYLRLIACFICLLSLVAAKELAFVQAIWRHGDRAPKKHPYPNDPYNESAWPRGWQQLTNIGIAQMNELGRYFRSKYGSFIAPHYVASQVYIRSSDSDRALTSAQAFTSGFYPAQNGSFQWQHGNPWQPVPIHAPAPVEKDLLLKPTYVDCKNYDSIVDADDAKHAAVYNTQYADMFKMLEEKTGIANFSYANVNKVYDITKELYNNLTDKQPAWAFQRWPKYGNRSTLDVISELRRIRKISKFDSPDKAKMTGGYLLNTWIKDALKVANGTMKNPDRMMLYSAHDGTVLALMHAMSVANGLLIPYASAVIMEVYKDKNDFLVELFYRNDTSKPPYRLQIPGCSDRCTVQKMAEQYSNMMVTSLSEHQEVCGTPIIDCNKSTSAPFSLAFIILVVAMQLNLL
ncbi:unnamed protein product [Cylicocyclus nassatus]|uniref:Acid phosphatase n=1 Tax=Cylicocyclus nassatus TaxID=53992 RepID=A0AA36H4D6_CYLNA|nr:unnamed protein product [Cylicocyclus nassatus]